MDKFMTIKMVYTNYKKKLPFLTTPVGQNFNLFIIIRTYLIFWKMEK